MRPLLIALVVAIGFAPQIPGLAQAPAAPPTGPRVQVTFEPGGLVSVVANGATLREVLSQWESKGGTKFNGAEKLTGGALTVQFDHRPETEVMASLLRNASGVVIATKDEGATGASTLGAVFVVATSNPTSSGYSQPAYTPQPQQVSTVGSPDQEIAPVGPGRSGEPPQQAPAPAPRPAGSSVAVAVVPVTVPVVGAGAPPATTGTTGTGTTTGTAGSTTTTGSGRGGGGGGGR
jgi:hypothetical protein